ncbi:hypothetical protein F4821DRAFT_84523 [Hypoxylon rubiginosum]|uniref:Uncharacterized protein n=1 Tax=Hypoxylon rubiginosum TaxID=110542 RepID=A0ACC0CI86_9PEZI|nr:hypothetical protein F4821DRAFT_84523 [Hypoxylon rubiginosum]
MAQHQPPNLDHIVVRVRHRDRSVNFTLNTFLNDSGKAAGLRVSSHYDYDGIREYLQIKLHLQSTEPLVFGEAGKVCSRHDLEVLIISIQMGNTILPSLDGSLAPLPELLLRSESSARSSETNKGREENNKISDPTPQNPPGPSSKDNTGQEGVDASGAPRLADPIGKDCSGLHSKRGHPEHPEQSLAKRQKAPVIELSDDDDESLAEQGEPESDSLIEGVAACGLGLEDDDANEEDSRQQIEDIGRQFANRSISAEDWKSVCRMFQCPEESTEYKPVGFKLAISGYQLHAIWWQITQFPLRGVPGGCLGDEMGLGKTVEVLSVFVVFARIKMNYQEVWNYWKKGKVVNGRKHLSRSQRRTVGLVCPSQRNSPYGLLCSCVKSGETYLVATELPSLPTICFAPPSSIHGWRREFEKLVDLTDPIMKKLKLSIMHTDFKGDETYYHSSDRVQATMGKAVKCHVDKRGQPNCYLNGREGLSNWFLLVSSSGAPGLLNAYNGKEVVYRSQQDGDHDPRTSTHEGKTFTTDGLAASFVFFDEAHAYKGSLSSPTQPFSLLRTITRKSWEPTVAFAVSGSIPGGGPGQLTNIVDHILYVKNEREDGTSMIGGITRAAELEEKKSDWNYLLQKNHIISNSKTKAEVEKRRKSMGKLMKDLVPHILMARRNVDTFRGKTIGDDGRRIVVEPIQCNMMDGPGRDAFCKLTANVQTYVSQALDQRRNAWVQGGSKGPEPTQRSVEQEFFGGSSDSTALKLGKVWTQLLRANVYPVVAHLYVKELVGEDDLGASSVNHHGDNACASVVSGASPSILLQKLSESPFWKHRAKLRKQSSKFQKLCEYVEDMVAYRDHQPDANDPGPADGTNIRHMVVFTDSPVSSFITFMLLCQKYPNIQVMLINGCTPTVAAKKVPEYGRREMLDNLMSDCEDDSPNKILVTTYRICGTALNMQRANYCIMMEPARDAREESQAAARVNRRGQLMKVVTVRLYDDRNLPEVLKRARHQNQHDMVAWQEKGIRWGDFVQ